VATIQQTRELTLAEEIQFLKNTEKIELDALDKKIKLYQRQKSLDAQQLKDLAELQQARAETILKNIEDEQKLRQEAFDKQAALAKQALDTQVTAIRERADTAAANPNLSEEERVRIKTEADREILAAQTAFNAAMDALEKQLGANSLKNAKLSAAEIAATRKQILEDQKALLEAKLADIGTEADKQRARLDSSFAQLRQAILENDKLTFEQRQNALAGLEATAEHSILAGELDRLTKEFKLIAVAYAVGLATEKQFLDAKLKMEQAANNLAENDQTKSYLIAEIKRLKNAFKVIKEQYRQGLIDEETFFRERDRLRKAKAALAALKDTTVPSAQNTQSIVQNSLSQAFGFDENSAQDKLLGAAIAQSFSLATDAMHAYFDAEQQRIQQSLDLTLQRIDLEKEQRTARAQSQAEIDSIEKQAEAKKRVAQRQAGEQLKKAKLSEAKISLATELANIAAAAAANPANSITFGAAGAAMYAILAALALARYAINVGSIQRATFARGGEVPTRGGRFGGRSHAQGGTRFGVDDFEAEVDELAIIRTRNAPKGRSYTITGTQTEIASALNKVGGGTDFAPGAEITDKPGILRRLFPRKARVIALPETESVQKTVQIVQNVTQNVQTSTINDRKLSKLTRIVDTFFRHNALFIERADRSEVVSRVLSEVQGRKKTLDTDVRETVTRMVTDRLDAHTSRIVDRVVRDKHVSDTHVDEIITRTLDTIARNRTEIAIARVEEVIRFVESRMAVEKVMAETHAHARTESLTTKMTETITRALDEIANRTGEVTDTERTEVTRLVENRLISTESAVRKAYREEQERTGREFLSRNTSIINRVFTENRAAVTRRDDTFLLNRALEITTTEVTTAARIAELTRLIRERFTREDNRVYTMTGTTWQIFKGLDHYAKQTFAFGGRPGEVPVRGGVFGGKSHAQGGTDFSFKGKAYNAEVDELAIIRTRNAPKGKRYTLTGTQAQIASALNKIGGGHDFAPGATLRKFATGGVLGTLEAPVFTVATKDTGTSEAVLKELQALGDRLDAQAEATHNLAAEQSRRIDRIRTFVLEKDISDEQDKTRKRTAVGTLP